MCSAPAFPDEILDAIMRASWPGIRLGLTCRRLRAKLTDELVDKWAVQIVENYTDREFTGDPISREAAHHELPNGVFHGHSRIELCMFRYSRGRIVSGVGMSAKDAGHSYVYYKNMLVVGKTSFLSKGMTLCVSSGTLFFGDTSRVLNVDILADTTDPIARYEKMLPEIRALFGDRFERHVSASENRPKILVDTTFAGIDRWPDCQLWE